MQDKIAGIIETNCPFVEQWDTSECAAKIIAALPDMVQPLVWHWDMIKNDWYAVGLGKTYWAMTFSRSKPSLEDVSHQQADYSRRILSAFGITGET